MDSIFAKFFLIIASLFTITGSGVNYIQVNQENLVFDFKTGDTYPVYYILFKNIGPQKARFDISSNVSWIYVYREGQSQITSLELPEQAAINFVLEIHPENLSDGRYQAKITINAVDVFDYQIIDSQEINVTLNKNLGTLEISPTPEGTSLATPEPEISVSATPTPTFISTPTPTPLPSASSAELNPILNQLKSIFDSLRTLLLNFFGV